MGVYVCVWGGGRIIILISGMQALAVDTQEVWRSVLGWGECVGGVWVGGWVWGG